jgi:hypothetical protein
MSSKIASYRITISNETNANITRLKDLITQGLDDIDKMMPDNNDIKSLKSRLVEMHDTKALAIEYANTSKTSLESILNHQDYEKLTDLDKRDINNYIGVVKSIYDLLMMSEVLLAEMKEQPKQKSKGGSKRKTRKSRKKAL